MVGRGEKRRCVLGWGGQMGRRIELFFILPQREVTLSGEEEGRKKEMLGKAGNKAPYFLSERRRVR